MMAAAILIFDKGLYLQGRLRLTTARQLSAYMLSSALATTTASSFCNNSVKPHYISIIYGTQILK